MTDNRPVCMITGLGEGTRGFTARRFAKAGYRIAMLARTKERLDKLKPTCGIVNIGRQSVLDYKTLCDKLDKEEIAGAILDVFTPEPIESNSKLWHTKNLVITPHVSSDDNGNYVKMTLELFVKNLKLFILDKKLLNQIDRNLGY